MIKCPICGASYYQELFRTTTALGWTPTYKNGILINSNPNKTTRYCQCLQCGNGFETQEEEESSGKIYISR